MNEGRKSKFLGGVVSMGASALLTIALSFITVIIVARIIPEEEYGVYFLLLAIVYLLDVIGGFGLQLSAAKFIASALDRAEQEIIVNNLLTFCLATVSIVSVLSLVGKSLLLSIFPSDALSDLFLYIPIIYFVQAIDRLLSYVMQGFQMYKPMSIIAALTGVINFVLIILFVGLFRMGLQGLLLATTLSFVVSALARYQAVPTQKRLAFDPKLIRQIIRFGLPLQSNSVLTFISQRLDVLILGAFLSPAHVAYLGVAGKIPQSFQKLYESLYSVYFPHMTDLFARGQKAQAEEVLHRFLRLTSLFTLTTALVAVLFQHEIITLIFSERYAASAPAFGLLMVILTMSVAGTILDTTLIAAGNPNYVPFISLADTIPSMIANLILIPPLGFMGAVIAKMIANLTSNPLCIWALNREGIAVRSSAYFKPAAIALVCVLLYLLPGGSTLLHKLLTLALFFGLGMLFSVIAAADVADVMTLWQQAKRKLTYKFRPDTR